MARINSYWAILSQTHIINGHYDLKYEKLLAENAVGYQLVRIPSQKLTVTRILGTGSTLPEGVIEHGNHNQLADRPEIA